MINGDALLGAIRILNSLSDLLAQVAIGIIVFGNDEHAQVGPFRSRLSFKVGFKKAHQ